MDVKARADDIIETPRARRLDAPERMPEIEPAGPLGPIPSPRRYTLSPINRRRWENFRSNRRGYWSLWIFLALFVVTLFAEFIANDKPLYISYSGKSYFPVFFNYPETAFGGQIIVPPLSAISFCT